METLDYICQQVGHLQVVKSIPSDVEKQERDRLVNRAMDVRSACILYLAAQLRRDESWLGIVGMLLDVRFDQINSVC